jgi:hypothetical protein
MAFDSCTTWTAAPVTRPDANAALRLYQIARTAGAPAAYEAAAHALAAALQAANVAARLDRPADQRQPARAADSDPATPAADTGETRRANLPRRPSAKAAPAGDDLAGALGNIPKNKLASGAFVVTWADGSETFVSAVSWHAGKPATRWAAAFQAADRLRRMRGRAAYAADLATGADSVARYYRDGSGLERETPDFQALTACRPLPALATIGEELTGETFTAPDGSAFGAGDPDRARALEAAICQPFTPWRLHERRQAAREGLAKDWAYFRPAAPDVADSAAGGWSWFTGWPQVWRDEMRRDALAAFAPEAPAAVTADKGEALTGADPRDVDGAAVVIDLEAAHRRSAIAFPEREPEGREQRAAWDHRREAWARGARAAMAMAETHPGRVWTLHAGPLGRSFTIEGPGGGRSFNADALAFIARAA